VDRALGLSVVGIVPNFFEEGGSGRKALSRRGSAAPRHRPPASDHLIVLGRPHSPTAQSFRLLRGNLELCLPHESSRGSVLLITSPGQFDGKSTIAANLAVSFAQKHWRTLLVDAHLNKPAVHALFDAPQHPGLVQILERQVSLAGVLSRRNDPNTFLDIVTAGEGGEAIELSEQIDLLRRNLDELRNYYRIILIDAPGVLENKAVRALVHISDRVVLVFRSHWTSLRDGAEAIKRVEVDDGRLCGGVLNSARLPRDWSPRVPGIPS
jgi:Mrp family chromosome partitioning ATPase